MSSDEEAAAVKAMRQAYDDLKKLGWQDISRFKPKMKSYGSVPFLGIEVWSDRPIECLYEGKDDEDKNIFVSFEKAGTGAVQLIMFRHYKEGTRS